MANSIQFKDVGLTQSDRASRTDGKFLELKPLILNSLIYFSKLNFIFSHRQLETKNPNTTMLSLSGCTAIGVDTANQFGIVHKTVGMECGIYRSYVKGEAPIHYTSPLNVEYCPHKRKFYPIFFKNTKDLYPRLYLYS